MKSLLIKDTTREHRIQIITQGLNQCGGGSTETFFKPCIDGEKELRALNMEYAYGGRVMG